MSLFKGKEALGTAEAALGASSRIAATLSKLNKRLDSLEERLKAIEDSVTSGEVKTLIEEKEYIDGMFNMLTYDIDKAKKAKGRELNE